MRILLDQNVPIGLRRWIKRIRPDWDVFDVKQQKLWGKPDSEIMSAARRLGAVLITFDRDFASEKPLRPEQPAIVCLLASPTTEETAKRLLEPILRDPSELKRGQRVRAQFY